MCEDECFYKNLINRELKKIRLTFKSQNKIDIFEFLAKNRSNKCKFRVYLGLVMNIKLVRPRISKS